MERIWLDEDAVLKTVARKGWGFESLPLRQTELWEYYMGNRLSIQPTVFETYPNGVRNFGVLICDDYGSEYIDFWNQEDLTKPPLEILRKLTREGGDKVWDLLGPVQENQHGVFLGEIWYPWEEIKDAFENPWEEY